MNLSLIIFLLLFSSGIVLTITADLSWGIALYILLYFIFPANRWWYTIPRFRYTLFLAIVFIIVYLFRKRSNSLFGSLFPQAKILLIMIGLMGIISFWAVWPTQHFRFLLLQVKQFIFMFIAYQVIDREDKFERILWAYLAGCFYIGYIAHVLPRNEFGRLEGIGMPDGANADTTAAVLITAIPFLINYFICGKKIEKFLALFFFPFVADAIILLNSRGAFLALVVALAYYLFMLLRQKIIRRRDRIIALCLALACTGIFIHLADPTFWHRMAGIKAVKAGHGDATRTNFWLAAIKLSEKHPFGLGVNGFEFLSPSILPQSWLNRKTGTIAVHSTYFEALVEFGFAGIALLAAFILSTIKSIRRVMKQAIAQKNQKLYLKSVALSSAYFAFMLAIIFINRLYAEVFYWLMLFSAIFVKISLPPSPKALDKQPLQTNDENRAHPPVRL